MVGFFFFENAFLLHQRDLKSVMQINVITTSQQHTVFFVFFF